MKTINLIVMLVTLLSGSRMYAMSFSASDFDIREKEKHYTNPDDDPVASFTTKGNLCVGDTIWFISESTGYETLLWDFGDGITTWNRDTVFHIYTGSDVYYVTLTAISEDGTRNTDDDYMYINPLPSIYLSFDGSYTLEDDEIYQINEGRSLTISVSGSYEEIIWYTSEQGELGETNYITVEKADSYIIMVTDNNGCTNWDTTIVEVIEKESVVSSDSSEIVVNNIITPNNDGYNDYLLINLYHFTYPCEVYIYNMWGDLVYNNKDYYNEDGWDGTGNGKLLDAGTYYYVIKSEGMKGIIGYIDLIR